MTSTLRAIVSNVMQCQVMDGVVRNKFYSPHNAILFCDENNNLLEFIEICFHCHASEVCSEKISLGDICSQKYDLLQDFFLKTGIEIDTKLPG